MRQRRACWGVLVALVVVGSVGCGDDQGQRDSATVPIVQSDAGAPDGAVMVPSCVDGTPGCACADDSEPMTCYPPPIITKSGTNLCAQGTMYCRDGKWSTCESLVQYELNSTATDPSLSDLSRLSDLGSTQSALVTPPTTCNVCKPNCFTAVDRPVTNDFDAGSAPNVTYDPVQAGIRLTIKEDTAQRGPLATPAECGNGIVESVEQCDDGNKRTLDGCDANCLLENGFFCPLPGLICLRSVCGNGVREGLEQCDDGNFLIGDGCTFLCTKEPDCTTGSACTPVCGDGKVFPGEACDDGNTVSGDGCTSSCGLEVGFVCANNTTAPPDFIDLPIVYRDFVGKDNALKPLGILTNPYIHLDFENLNVGSTTGMVQLTWETNKNKATYKKPIASMPLNANKALQSAAGFDQWYTDDSSVNKTFADTLRVTRNTSTGVYAFDSTAFFPLDTKANTWVATGWEKASSAHNFSFTSEVRFWFIYNPPQALDFRGDDDVWVFINGRRAVDIGGVHGPGTGSITLNASNAATFGLTAGQLYEAAVFQAERHTSGSNYRLTLAGFVTGKTSCVSVCGDGIVTPDEFCDDGNKNGMFGFCLPDCQGRAPVYFPTASYARDYTATGTCKIPPERPLWGALNWSAVATAGGTITFELRPSETAAGLASATPVSVTIPPYTASGAFDIRNALLTGGATLKDPPYLRVTAILRSSLDMKQTPVLRSFDVTYNCVNIE